MLLAAVAATVLPPRLVTARASHSSIASRAAAAVSPSAVIEELVPLFESYRISRITGDRWAGGFPPEQFQQQHIKYEACVKVKSDLYVDLLPLLNSGRILLPRHPRLAAQLISLDQAHDCARQWPRPHRCAARSARRLGQCGGGGGHAGEEVDI